MKTVKKSVTQQEKATLSEYAELKEQGADFEPTERMYREWCCARRSPLTSQRNVTELFHEDAENRSYRKE